MSKSFRVSKSSVPFAHDSSIPMPPGCWGGGQSQLKAELRCLSTSGQRHSHTCFSEAVEGKVTCQRWLTAGAARLPQILLFQLLCHHSGMVDISRWPLGARQTPGASHTKCAGLCADNCAYIHKNSHRDHLISFWGLTQALLELALARRHSHGWASGCFGKQAGDFEARSKLVILWPPIICLLKL